MELVFLMALANSLNMSLDAALENAMRKYEVRGQKGGVGSD